MSMMDMIMGQLSGGDTVKQLGNMLGTDDKTTGTAMSAAVGSLLGALAKNSSDSQGAESLSNALSRDHDGSILDNVQGYLSKGQSGDGDGILGHVLGNKRAALERGIGKSSGMDGQSVSKLMAMMAPMVLGALGKAKRQNNMGSSDLAGMLGKERESLQKKQPQAMSALTGFLDSDGDGDVDFGDLASQGMGLLGKFLRK